MRRFTKFIFILCNLLLSICLILGCYGSRINEGDYWFLGLFTLATPYLVLLNMLFILFWLFIKKIFSLIGVITFLICFSPLMNVIQIRKTNFKKERSNTAAIRVMNWNVEHFDIVEYKTHPEVKNQMIGLINETNPDIACFQEMVAGEDANRSINYLPDFCRDFKMPYHSFSYNKKHDFDKWHHFGKIIFSKYPIINEQTICSDTSNYNSCFQYIDVVKNNDTFRVFNIHLQTFRFSKTNKNYIDDPTSNNEDGLSESKSIVQKIKKAYIKRHRQADWIKKEMNKSRYPIILCGDFNDVPNSYAYTHIGKDMKNAFEEKGSWIDNTFYNLSSTLRIDNIFVSAKFSVDQYIRIKKKLSDHYPIVADLIY
jgi:endonuclease/exonuclease/phosphatase family metal-dependent hydrolase